MAEFDDALDRMVSDPAFAARVRAAYSGRHPLDDVAWWQRHPLEPGPTGSPAPAAEREALARQVYARAAAPHDAERRLIEADAAITADRDALFHALAAASTPEPLEPDPASEADAPPTPTPASADRRSLVIAVAAIAAVALVGGSFLVGRSSAPQPVPSQPATASALAVFDRPVATEDSPTVGGGANFLPETYRKLEDVAAPDSPLGNDSVASVVYAVRSRDGRACLLVESSGGVAAVTCIADADFPADGLRIYWREGQILRGTTWAANGEMVDSGLIAPGSSKDSVG